MARIRTIKPSMFKSLRVASWPFPARWLFAGLLTYLDDSGRGLDEPRLIKSELFPLDDQIGPKTIDKFLDQLAENHGPICRYQYDGQGYIHIRSWGEHQRINRPRKSELPACPLHDPDAQGTLDLGEGS